MEPKIPRSRRVRTEAMVPTLRVGAIPLGHPDAQKWFFRAAGAAESGISVKTVKSDCFEINSSSKRTFILFRRSMAMGHGPPRLARKEVHPGGGRARVPSSWVCRVRPSSLEEGERICHMLLHATRASSEGEQVANMCIYATRTPSSVYPCTQGVVGCTQGGCTGLGVHPPDYI